MTAARRLVALPALLMVTALGACDNVEWGGLDLAIVRPPPTAGPAEQELDAADRLPDYPILYHVRRDSARATIVPVGEIVGDRMEPIRIGDDPDAYGMRFISAFLRQGVELTLFHRGRRAGTVIVDSASVPGADARLCRRVPRATGSVELAGVAGDATEFLAMARTQAPQGQVYPGRDFAPERRMEVVGNILAERALRARGAQLPNWAVARRQIQPFPVAGTQDFGFTATFLVDDDLSVGRDDNGYALFVVYTPQAQTGYDTAYVRYTSYPADGKAAPRVIDFLDWNRSGQPDLLLEVYGTRNSWFEAVGRTGDRWERTFRDECDGPGRAIPADTAARPVAATPPNGQVAPPGNGSPTPATPTAARTTRQQQPQAAPLPDVQPTIRIAPGTRPRPDSIP